MNLADLPVTEARRQLQSGEISSLALLDACLERIDALEERVKAWAQLDRDLARSQARQADALRAGGAALGPLHGIPIGIKDIIDTRDLPCEHGSSLSAGRMPGEDAALVAQLRAAGAVILGKTVTTEFAVYTPNETTNPHDAGRTPGGSSSGSAAAVAAGMVPAAIGSQTNGSVIRPASFCGVIGYKPSFGLISRRGMLAQSQHLDHAGVFARSLADAALVAESLMAFDHEDAAMTPKARPRLLETMLQGVPVTPAFAFVKSPVWERADEDAKAGIDELVAFLGEGCDRTDLPERFAEGYLGHQRVFTAELARSFAGFYDRGKDQLSPVLRGLIEEGQKVLAIDYNSALEWREVLYAGLEQIFERCDAILTLSAAGQAPLGLEATGDPAFCTLWTFLGVPAVSLPLLRGAEGLPIGVQLIGRRGDDARLLRNAHWLVDATENELQ